MADNPYMQGGNPFMPSSPMDAAQGLGADNDTLHDMYQDGQGGSQDGTDAPAAETSGYGVAKTTKPRQIPGGQGAGGGADLMGVPQQPTGYATAKTDLGAYLASVQVQADLSVSRYQRARDTWKKYKGKKSEAPIGNNTTTWSDEHGNQHIRLHDTNVVSYSPGGTRVTFRNGGWPTPTTHSRIREFGPPGYIAYRNKGKTTISTPGGNHDWEEGISFNTDSHKRLPNNAVEEGEPESPPGQTAPKAPAAPKLVKPKTEPRPGETFKDFLRRLSNKQAGLVIQRRVVPGLDPELSDYLRALAEEHAVGLGHDVRNWQPQEGGVIAHCENCPAQVQLHHSSLGGVYGGSAVREPCPNSRHMPYASPVATKVAQIAAQARQANPSLSEEAARRIARKTVVRYPALVKRAEDLNPLDFGVKSVPDGPLLGENKSKGRPQHKSPQAPDVSGEGAEGGAEEAAGGAGEAAGAEGAAEVAGAAGEGASVAEVAPLLLAAL